MDAKESSKPPDGGGGSRSTGRSTGRNNNNNNNNNNNTNGPESRIRTKSDSSGQPPPMPPRPVNNALNRRSTDGSGGRASSQRPSASSLGMTYRSSSANGRSNDSSAPSAHSSVRAVPSDDDDGSAVADNAASSSAVLDPLSPPTSRDRTAPHESSPRSVPGGPCRRQGVVFNDPVSDGGDPATISPSTSIHSSTGGGASHRAGSSSTFRPRTRTMDTALLGGQRVGVTVTIEHRQRVGSISSSNPVIVPGDEAPRPGHESVGFPSIVSSSSVSAAPASTSSPSAGKNDKKSSGRRLIKRHSSRPTSPQPTVPPSIDSMPSLIPTENPRKISLLMRVLCGKMRGEIEYQGGQGGPWHSGVAYIDDERACLMFDSGQNGPFHIPLVTDLRGCCVLPVDYRDADKRCLEIASSNPVVEFLMYPLVHDEFDMWLAALLCWQQLRPSTIKTISGGGGGGGDGKAGNSNSSGGSGTGAGTGNTSPSLPMRPEVTRRDAPGGNETTRPSNIIKVGKLKVWDKGPASNPRSLVRRSSTRDARSPQMSWRRISCILHDNGEFKIMAENDVTILAVLGLSHLSRFAIQQLDHSVLDEEHCIAIFPMYSSTSTHVSVYRPVFLALDNRTHFEVWFALLRAFALPDMYKIKGPIPANRGRKGSQGYGDDDDDDEMHDIDDVEKTQAGGEVFRVEKTILVRVTEAKIRSRPAGMELPTLAPSDSKNSSKAAASDSDAIQGNYLAEVILDGEVRARTTVRPATSNPFWREDCEFIDLPSTMPDLSVVLKQVDDAGPDAASQSSHPSSSKAPHQRGLTEVVWGSVELPLAQTRGGLREMEDWMQVLDDTGEPIGSMLVKVVHEDHIVLLEKEYRELGELLHNFNSGLTSLVATALPTHLRRLAELFLNIFQVSGSAGEWLMALVEEEIDGMGNHSAMRKLRFDSRLKSNDSAESVGDRGNLLRDMGRSLAGEANLLFRGNTLLTQALELHMRRLGRDFLIETLKDKLFEINEANPDCEVDPSKMASTQSHPHPHHGHGHGHAQGGGAGGSNSDGGDIEQHWTRLIDLTTEVWECIAVSASRMHAELRGILKYVRAVAEDRYGDFLRSVSYTSVSGFLFLRFICPAILSPKLFGLLRDHPQPRAQRTFTLIAKALQKLSNLSMFGKREEWMEPMNRFLSAQRPRFRDYIDAVCDVTPSEREMRTFHASYRTPMTILSRLSPTAREGFPSLPFLRHRLSEARRDANSSSPDDLADILDQASLVESLSYAQSSSTWYDSSHHRFSTSELLPRLLQGTVTTTIVGGPAAKSSGGSVRNGASKRSRAILNGIMRRGNDSKEKK
ncbi:RasGAP [Geosmithia morbida]|uniref:RasGAP n=1 Tax=Geosmithia morbida TaxID=1094350 RepID=A0A9P5D124_9HYPO|nr:RasGAP [Geosmithia morbida]KAF4120016.1 RasGAP [Geosmithia morbida]